MSSQLIHNFDISSETVLTFDLGLYLKICIKRYGPNISLNVLEAAYMCRGEETFCYTDSMFLG
jgi:hypothetical protein